MNFLNTLMLINENSIGWYRDESGHLKHGAIPKQNKYEVQWRK